VPRAKKFENHCNKTKTDSKVLLLTCVFSLLLKPDIEKSITEGTVNISIIPDIGNDGSTPIVLDIREIVINSCEGNKFEFILNIFQAN
jgi:hypothetical protein